MSIIDRVRANGGEVIRDGHTIRLRRGKLTDDALAWVAGHRDDLMREAWPEFDAWAERAAIMEFDGGMSRAEAEAAAYQRVMAC